MHQTQMETIETEVNGKGLTLAEFDQQVMDQFNLRLDTNLLLNVRNLDESTRLQMCVMLINCARHKRHPNLITVPWRMRLYDFTQSNAYRRFRKLVVLLLMATSFLQPLDYTNEAVWALDTAFQQTDKYLISLIMETFCITYFLWDLVLEYLSKPVNRTCMNLGFVANVTLTFCLAADLVLDMLVTEPFTRPFRVLRACKILFVSQRTSRNVRAILNAVPNVLDLFVLITFTLLLFGITGVHLFAGLYESEVPDLLEAFNVTTNTTNIITLNTNTTIPMEENFDNIGNAMTALFNLMTRVNWPGIGLPAYLDDSYLVIYFVIFRLVSMVLVLSAPVSVVFMEFKKARKIQILRDRLRERKGLTWAFHIMDADSRGVLSYVQFESLMRMVLSKRELPYARQYFALLDDDNSKTISQIEFMTLNDVLFWTVEAEGVKQASKCRLPRKKCHRLFKFRSLLARKLKLKQFVESTTFNVLVVLVVIANTVVLALFNRDLDDDFRALLDSLDSYFLYFYVAEMVVKILGLSFQVYWRDRWNQFDFVLVVFSFIVGVIIPTTDDVSGVDGLSLVAGNFRLARFARFGKFLKVSRAMRLVSTLVSATARFDRLLQKLFVSIPAVFDTFWTIMLVFHIYATLGGELFSTAFQNRGDSRAFEEPEWVVQMTNFDSFTGVSLALFQVFTSTAWHKVLYALKDCTKDTSLVYLVFPYLASFYVITVFILTNLLLALIWEVFMVLDKSAESQSGPPEEDHADAREDSAGLVRRKTSTNKKELDQQLYLTDASQGYGLGTKSVRHMLK